MQASSEQSLIHFGNKIDDFRYNLLSKEKEL